MKKITLARHGQSLYNAEKRLAGQADIALTDIGIDQAKKLNRYIKDKDMVFDHAFSSALQRAEQTARLALNGLNTKLRCTPLLNERCAGRLTHALHADVAASSDAHILNTIYHTPDLAFPEGECFLDVLNRAQEFVELYITPLKDRCSIFIASHAITTQGLLVALKQKTIEEAMALKIENATPIMFEID